MPKNQTGDKVLQMMDRMVHERWGNRYDVDVYIEDLQKIVEVATELLVDEARQQLLEDE